MPQAQTGKTRSVPKVVRVNAADSEAVIYRNLGNGRRLPFMWGTSVTLASGTTSVVVASGVKFHEYAACSGIIVATPRSSIDATVAYYVHSDNVNNIVTLRTAAGYTSNDVNFDVLIMLGVGHDFSNTDSNSIWRGSPNVR